MTQRYDRFNLEEEIQNIWQTKDDLDAVTERYFDEPNVFPLKDDIVTVLAGLSELHDIRCKKLWKVFETMVKEKAFVKLEK